MTSPGRSLELFFVDGRPGGLTTAEVFNWTGHVLRIPRTEIVRGLSREQAKFTGAYLLLGEQRGNPCAYVGEGEDVAERIRSHDVKRDWWSEAVIITTLSNNLHKAHVKYLESRIVEKARAAAVSDLENGNTPPRSSLSEAAIANMEEFLSTLDIALAALGIELMNDRRRRAKDSRTVPAAIEQVPQPLFECVGDKGAIRARARLDAEVFSVQAGSMARGTWIGTDGGYKALYQKLVETGVLVSEGSARMFADSYAFSSPSAAAAVVLGRSSNGRIEWKMADGRTYADWERETLGTVG